MMAGSEILLHVYLEKANIATLTLLNEDLQWHYSEAWQKSGYALSPHLPLHQDIPSINVQRFLRNLFPEGNGLDELLQIFHISRYNIFGLIRALGLDTPGALIMLPPENKLPTEAIFRIITNDELEQRLNIRNEFSLIIWDEKPRLSVAGIQDKINVMLNNEGQLGFGEGSLCSTHILKFEKQKFKSNHPIQ
ncbi:MAG: HipA N-terminal domain-containing protein [Gammaproteobacteria bacterium]